MSKFAEAILKAEKISTKKEKFAALSGFGPNELRLVTETFNPYRVFGIKKYDKPQAYASHDTDFKHFFDLLDMLADRKIVGNAARAAVTAVLGQYTEHTSKVLERVLLKDLDCGANRTTFETIYPNLKIPKYSVMLAKNMEEDFEWGFDNGGYKIAEVKYDGLRVVAEVENGSIKYLSREGKPLPYDGLFDEELLKIEQKIGPFVLDGEGLSTNFNESMQSKGAKNAEVRSRLRFMAFDLLPMSEWRAQKSTMKQKDRSAWLEKMIKDLGLQKIVKSEYVVCTSYEQIRAFYDRVCKAGGEGLIIKDPNATYSWKRVPAWTKWKPVFNYDLKIVGFYEGKGHFKGMLGGFVLDDVDGASGKHVKTECGGGFSKKQRQEIWMNTGKYLNKVAEIEGKELCKAKNSDVWAVREPVFIRVRDDK